YEIYSYLELFDILIIPHSVGKNENGGDPLKLYQYLNARKKIISTGILGVDEFKEIITITNNYEEWINEIEEYDTNESPKYKTPNSIFWENRARDLINFILMDSK
ncbi:glycosyltransferase family 1 protein, partial [Enterococcus faecium]|nr:glycosyltransferase family 1 protein [Enterococcus faecium]